MSQENYPILFTNVKVKYSQACQRTIQITGAYIRLNSDCTKPRQKGPQVCNIIYLEDKMDITAIIIRIAMTLKCKPQLIYI